MIALTGAGISKASGIPTFEDMPHLRNDLTADAWNKRPQDVWRVIWDFYKQSNEAEPNVAHIALAEKSIPIITQNIDGLHIRAGSKPEHVIELHGQLRYSYCWMCHTTTLLSSVEYEVLPKCQCGTILQPPVVLYGQPVKLYNDAEIMIRQYNELLVIGTSLTTEPAASLVKIARRSYMKISVFNESAEMHVPKYLDEHL